MVGVVRSVTVADIVVLSFLVCSLALARSLLWSNARL